MKVLHVNMSIDSITGGGTAERVFQLSRYMSLQGVESRILTTSDGVTPERLNQLFPSTATILPLLWKRFYLPVPLFSKISDEIKWADRVHISGHWTILNAWAYFFCRIYRKPYAVCPSGALPIFGRSRVIKKIYNLFIGKKIIQNASLHIAITSSEFPAFAEYGISEDKIQVIPNGVEFSTYQVNHGHQNRAFKGRPYILFIGRMNYIKGPDLLVEAFAQVANHFSNIDLVFAGPDEGQVKNILEIAKQNQLSERVRYIGYIGGQEKQMILHESLLFVVPSRQEAMSIVALEAGAQGVPVLLTDQCGFNEINQNGGTVVPATVQGLSQGLRELLSRQAELNGLGRKLRLYVEANYSWQKMSAKLVKLLE